MNSIVSGLFSKLLTIRNDMKNLVFKKNHSNLLILTSLNVVSMFKIYIFEPPFM
jgi:hypothetical protein